MKKIPTLFIRDPSTNRVTPECTPGCEWVLSGEGVATRKWDGTCCLIKDGALWKRRELRKGDAEPTGYVEVDFDENTGKHFGWVPVGDGPEDKWHREAFTPLGPHYADGTYELLGPKINGNPEAVSNTHALVRHGRAPLDTTARDFESLRAYLAAEDIEGIVWWHDDGRKAKLKKKDFGLRRKP